VPLPHIHIWASMGCSPGAPRLEGLEGPPSLGSPDKLKTIKDERTEEICIFSDVMGPF